MQQRSVVRSPIIKLGCWSIPHRHSSFSGQMSTSYVCNMYIHTPSWESKLFARSSTYAVCMHNNCPLRTYTVNLHPSPASRSHTLQISNFTQTPEKCSNQVASPLFETLLSLLISSHPPPYAPRSIFSHHHAMMRIWTTSQNPLNECRSQKLEQTFPPL